MNPRAAIYSEIQAQGGENDLLVEHAPLVKRIAHHMLARLPDSVQLEDLIQSGMIGLLEAARQFDASQGASFTTYAGIRIRGAMLDEIRRLDWTPRSVHRRGREVAQAARDIENRTGRDARDGEIMEALGITAEEYYQVLQDCSSARLFSLDEVSPTTGEAREPESDDRGPAGQLEDAGFRQALAETIKGLPEREQLVMSLYYEQELNLREIGEVLGVTESRVSQIHGRIMLKLKDRLADWTG